MKTSPLQLRHPAKQLPQSHAAFCSGKKRRKTDARSMSRAAVGELCHARRRKTSVAQLNLFFRLSPPAAERLTLLRAPIRGFASKPAPARTLLAAPPLTAPTAGRIYYNIHKSTLPRRQKPWPQSRRVRKSLFQNQRHETKTERSRSTGSFLHQKKQPSIIPGPKNVRKIVVQIIEIRIPLNHLFHHQILLLGDGIVRNFFFVDIFHRLSTFSVVIRITERPRRLLRRSQHKTRFFSLIMRRRLISA